MSINYYILLSSLAIMMDHLRQARDYGNAVLLCISMSASLIMMDHLRLQQTATYVK